MMSLLLESSWKQIDTLESRMSGLTYDRFEGLAVSDTVSSCSMTSGSRCESGCKAKYGFPAQHSQYPQRVHQNGSTAKSRTCP